jgi:hypothetical protein
MAPLESGTAVVLPMQQFPAASPEVLEAPAELWEEVVMA